MSESLITIIPNKHIVQVIIYPQQFTCNSKFISMYIPLTLSIQSKFFGTEKKAQCSSYTCTDSNLSTKIENKIFPTCLKGNFTLRQLRRIQQYMSYDMLGRYVQKCMQLQISQILQNVFKKLEIPQRFIKEIL